MSRNFYKLWAETMSRFFAPMAPLAMTLLKVLKVRMNELLRAATPSGKKPLGVAAVALILQHCLQVKSSLYSKPPKKRYQKGPLK